MRIGLIIFIVLFSNVALGQLNKFIGTWTTPNSDFIEIRDTTNNCYNSNFIEVKGRSEGLGIYLFGDTLSFQRRDSWETETGIEKIKIYRYDLKVLKINDTNLIVKPVSNQSKSFFNNKKTLTFTKQELAIDKSIKFEKIIFHTTFCMGSCPTYHLEIDNSKMVKFYAQEVYREYSDVKDDSIKDDYSDVKEDSLYDYPRIVYVDLYDHNKEGYFKGELNDKSYNELINLVQTCNLKTLQFRGINCCDGTIITIIVYYNGQRKYLKAMFPPEIARKLIEFLYNICEKNEFERTIEKFKIEE